MLGKGIMASIVICGEYQLIFQSNRYLKIPPVYTIHGKNRFATARGKFRFSRAIYPPPAVLKGLEASGRAYFLPVSSVRAQEASSLPK